MTLPGESQKYRPTSTPNPPPRSCHRGHIGLLLLGAAVLFPRALLAQASTDEKPLPGFSQTADAPAMPPSDSTQAAKAPPPSPGPAVAPTLPVARRGCSCDWLRHGFYLRFSSGLASTTFKGDGPSGPAKISGRGGVSSIFIGHSIVRGLILAGTLQSSEVSASFNGGPYADVTFTANGEPIDVTRKATASFSQIGAVVDWYPMENLGLHAGLSGGVSVVAVNNQVDESTWHGTGMGGSLFVGYDWPIASTWAFGLSLVVSSATKSSLKDKDSHQTGYELRPFSVGLAGSLLYF